MPNDIDVKARSIAERFLGYQEEDHKALIERLRQTAEQTVSNIADNFRVQDKSEKLSRLLTTAHDNFIQASTINKFQEYAFLNLLVAEVEVYTTMHRGKGKGRARERLRQSLIGYKRILDENKQYNCWQNPEPLTACLHHIANSVSELGEAQQRFRLGLDLCKNRTLKREDADEMLNLNSLREKVRAAQALHDELAEYLQGDQVGGETAKAYLSVVQIQLQQTYVAVENLINRNEEVVRSFYAASTMPACRSKTEYLTLPTEETGLTYVAVREVYETFEGCRKPNKNPLRFLQSPCEPMAKGARQIKHFVRDVSAKSGVIRGDDLLRLADIFLRRMLSPSWAAARKGDLPYQSQYLFACLAKLCERSNDVRLLESIQAKYNRAHSSRKRNATTSDRYSGRCYLLFPVGLASEAASRQSTDPNRHAEISLRANENK